MTDPVVNGPDTTPVPPRTAKPPGEAPDRNGAARAAGSGEGVRAPASGETARAAGSGETARAAASGEASRNGAPRDLRESAAPAAGGGPPETAAEGRARRRRGSRGGRNRNRPAGERASANGTDPADGAGSDAAGPAPAGDKPAGRGRRSRAAAGDDAAATGGDSLPEELPDKPTKGKARSAEAAARALVRKPKIGDTRPAPDADAGAGGATGDEAGSGGGRARAGGRRRRGGRGGRGEGANGAATGETAGATAPAGRGRGAAAGRRGRGARAPKPVEATLPDEPLDLDEDDLKRRRGRERKGRPVGRYLMCVSVGPKATQMAVLEGRNLIEHYVSRPADDIAQIHGNIYLGKVQNVLPGMEAAFVDIGTPKNAVLYRGDVQYDAEDLEEKGSPARIEQILKAKQTILCQVTKNPIAHKGARLTQEVSLPGRFVVLIPNSTTYGISKRLADDERRRLRNILDKVRPKGHGLIVRTAADGVTAEEIERDVLALKGRWEKIEALAKKTSSPALLYREPDMAVRVIREELNQNYRGIVIDDRELYEEVRSYVNAISPELVERVQFYDPAVEPLSVFERHHVHEQLHRALDKKVWLPSGGSIIVEHTEALTVIDVNTGKNVGSSSLEETVFKNNLEAAEEIAKQLRLRDIGGIIVIDFIDMEIEQNRKVVIKAFRDALARDKTRTQVFDISDLGLVEMTRKRIGEGLLEGFATRCPECEGRGLLIDDELLR
jgi:ribonuclease E